MSAGDPTRSPKSNAEWARNIQQQVDAQSSATSLRVGPWVLSAAADGSLIGSYVDGGSVVLARPPVGGENDPDSIADPGQPVLFTATKSGTPQSITSTGAHVIFDGIPMMSGGDWTNGKTIFDTVTVPVTGIYDVASTVFFASGGATLASAVEVNLQPRLGSRPYDGSGNAWLSSSCRGLLRLTEGDSIYLWACPDGTTRNVGAAATYIVPVPTSLSLTLVARM